MSDRTNPIRPKVSEIFTSNFRVRRAYRDAVRALATATGVALTEWEAGDHRHSVVNRAWHFLDGRIVDRHEWTLGGIWITGTRVRRYVLYKLGAEQPGRWKGEESVPPEEELDRLLDAQLAVPREDEGRGTVGASIAPQGSDGDLLTAPERTARGEYEFVLRRSVQGFHEEAQRAVNGLAVGTAGMFANTAASIQRTLEQHHLLQKQGSTLAISAASAGTVRAAVADALSWIEKLEAWLPPFPNRFAHVHRALQELRESLARFDSVASSLPEEGNSQSTRLQGDVAPSESYSEGDSSGVALPSEIQAALDVAAAKMTGDKMLVGDPVLTPVTEWLEEEGRLSETIFSFSQTSWLHVVEPEWLARCADDIGAPDAPRTERTEIIRGLLVRALDGDPELWGDEYPVRIRVPVATSSGEQLILGCCFVTFAQYPPVEWDGLFRSEDAYRRWLRSAGYVTSVRDFDGLDEGARAVFAGPSTPHCSYIVQSGARPADVRIPSRRPRTARFIGQVMWSWSPAHSRCDYLYLSLDSSHQYWLLWLEFHDEEVDDLGACAYAPKGQETETEAATALLECYYRGEEQECQ